MQPISEVVTLEEVWRLFKETDRKFQEAKDEMQRSYQKTASGDCGELITCSM